MKDTYLSAYQTIQTYNKAYKSYQRAKGRRRFSPKRTIYFISFVLILHLFLFALTEQVISFPFLVNFMNQSFNQAPSIRFVYMEENSDKEDEVALLDPSQQILHAEHTRQGKGEFHPNLKDKEYLHVIREKDLGYDKEMAPKKENDNPFEKQQVVKKKEMNPFQKISPARKVDIVNEKEMKDSQTPEKVQVSERPVNTNPFENFLQTGPKTNPFGNNSFSSDSNQTPKGESEEDQKSSLLNNYQLENHGEGKGTVSFDFSFSSDSKNELQTLKYHLSIKQYMYLIARDIFYTWVEFVPKDQLCSNLLQAGSVGFHFTVNKNGAIISVSFIEPNSQESLNHPVRKAIEYNKQYPPLPDGYNQASADMKLVVNPPMNYIDESKGMINCMFYLEGHFSVQADYDFGGSGTASSE